MPIRVNGRAISGLEGCLFIARSPPFEVVHHAEVNPFVCLCVIDTAESSVHILFNLPSTPSPMSDHRSLFISTVFMATPGKYNESERLAPEQRLLMSWTESNQCIAADCNEEVRLRSYSLHEALVIAPRTICEVDVGVRISRVAGARPRVQFGTERGPYKSQQF